jgi:hypothetical protein
LSFSDTTIVPNKELLRKQDHSTVEWSCLCLQGAFGKKRKKRLRLSIPPATFQLLERQIK